jgi:site-specific recombinase XerD
MCGSKMIEEWPSMEERLAIVPASCVFENVAAVVLNSVRADTSRRVYHHALIEFLAWHAARGCHALNKAIVQEYRADLDRRRLASSSINLRMSVIRKLATEAADNGLLAPEMAAGIARVRGAKGAGVQIGHWLTCEQAEALICRPDTTTKKGKRDRAVLAVLIGCGLRRNELVSLTFEHIQQRDGRWVVADLVGKGQRIRTVPMPAWAKQTVDEWAIAAGLSSGLVVRAVNKADHVTGRCVSTQAVFNIVRDYGTDLRLRIAPHDLRRTFAKLAHKGRAALEQIQLSLGHASILTTERYLGVRQNLSDAPCDHLGLDISRSHV